MNIIFSFFIWIYWSACIIAFFIVASVIRLVTFPFDPYSQIPNKMVRGVTWLMLKINPGWKWDIRGADKKKISRPTIVVANHQSFMDIMLLNRLPWTMKYVVWKRLYYIPFLGWLMSLTGQIGIHQKSVHALLKLEDLVDPIEDGIPAMIFPEGERTLTGNLQEFRGGAFILADHYNFNVLPVVLKGGYEALPRGRCAVSPSANFVVSVLDPVSPQEFESPEELGDMVHWLMEQELDKLQDTTDN